MTATATDTFTTTEVVAMTGASYRKLDYWARCGYIPDGFRLVTGTGHVRQWTQEQVDRAKLLVTASEIKAAPLDELAERIAEGVLR